MYKIGTKMLSSRGRIFDVRDNTLIAVITASPQNRSAGIILRSYTGGPATIFWGDGTLNKVTIPATGMDEEVSYYHVYEKVGVYNIGIVSNVDFVQVSSYNLYKLNAGYYKKRLEFIYNTRVMPYPMEVIPDYTSKIKQITIQGNSIVNLPKLDLENCELLRLRYPSEYLIGDINITNTSKLLIFEYYNYFNNSNINLHSLISKNKNIKIIEVAYCNGSKVGYEDISDLTLPDSIETFILYYTSKYTGEISEIINKYNSSLKFKTINTGVCLVDAALLNGDYYEKSPTTSFGSIQGDASYLSFKFRLYDFRITFNPNSYGDITKNITNLNNVNSISGAFLYIFNYGNVILDVAKLSEIKNPPASILLNDSGKWHGDVSTLGNMVGVRNFNLANLSSSTISNWGGLIDNIYNNKSLFSKTEKTFNCSTPMKNALTGIYQAPAGFVKSTADGNPTSHREKIYVLVNNYNWTFTYI